MLAKLITREGYEFRVDPLEVTGIVGLDRTVAGERSWVYTRQNSHIIIGTAEEVEAALAQARRVKVTRSDGVTVYLNPSSVTGVWENGADFHECGRCVTVEVETSGIVSVRESLAEVLAALDWAE